MRLRPGLTFAAIALAGAATLASPREASADPPRIIVVDIRRACLDTEEGLRVQASLKRLFDLRQRDLSEQERAFQTKQSAVQAKVQGGTPQSALTKELEDLQRSYVDLQQKRDQYTGEMQTREQQLTAPIYGRIVGLITKIAKELRADVIVDKAAAPFYRVDLEVTDRAIQMYNNGESAVVAPSGKPPPIVPARDGGYAPKPPGQPAPAPPKLTQPSVSPPIVTPPAPALRK